MLTDRATRVTTLTVHGVGPHPRELDPGEAVTWIDIAQLEPVLDLAMERPAVRLTFDDGNDCDVHMTPEGARILADGRTRLGPDARRLAAHFGLVCEGMVTTGSVRRRLRRTRRAMLDGIRSSPLGPRIRGVLRAGRKRRS